MSASIVGRPQGRNTRHTMMPPLESAVSQLAMSTATAKTNVASLDTIWEFTSKRSWNLRWFLRSSVTINTSPKKRRWFLEWSSDYSSCGWRWLCSTQHLTPVLIHTQTLRSAGLSSTSKVNLLPRPQQAGYRHVFWSMTKIHGFANGWHITTSFCLCDLWLLQSILRAKINRMRFYLAGQIWALT